MRTHGSVQTPRDYLAEFNQASESMLQTLAAPGRSVIQPGAPASGGGQDVVMSLMLQQRAYEQKVAGILRGMERDLDETDRDLTEKITANGLLSAEVERLNTEIEKHQKAIASHEKSLADAQSAHADAVKKLADDLDKEKSDLATATTTSEQSLADLQKQLDDTKTDYEKRLADLTTELDAVKKEREDLATEKEALAKEASDGEEEAAAKIAGAADLGLPAGDKSGDKLSTKEGDATPPVKILTVKEAALIGAGADDETIRLAQVLDDWDTKKRRSDRVGGPAAREFAEFCAKNQKDIDLAVRQRDRLVPMIDQLHAATV